LIFLAGRRLGGAPAGLLAAGLLALDGKAAGVAVLETAVNLCSLLALVCYLYRRRGGRGATLLLVLAGAGAGAATLMKVPGLALAIALPLHALLRRRPRQAALLVAGSAGAALLGLLPFLLVAPAALIRETFF